MKIQENNIDSGVIFSYTPKNVDYLGTELKLFSNDDSKNNEIGFLKSVLETLIEYNPEKEIAVYIGNDVIFVDCGENFNNVYCPKCSTEITEDWQDFMGKASENNFKDLEIKTKCCDFKTDLNSLNYDEKCGFSKVVFTIYSYDPNSISELINAIWKKHNLQLIPILAKY